MVENQVERIERELAGTSPEYLKTYVLSKAREFEKLRTQYERQVADAMAEMKRLGVAADSNLQRGMREGYKARDLEWLKWFREYDEECQIAMSGAGLIDVAETMRLLLEKEKAKGTNAAPLL